ncbi:MAG TPA: sigma factor [Nocardioidaceae bacterium]|nr:sigma factor [Nocardioidaceae bacterium]
MGAERRGTGWAHLGPNGPCPAELARLLILVSRGDQAAFASFFDATSPAVYGLAVGTVGDSSQAEAITREVFVTAWTLAGTFDATTSTPFGWLCGIAHTQIRLSSARATAAG